MAERIRDRAGRSGLLGVQLGDAEVEHLHRACIGDHDVLGLVRADHEQAAAVSARYLALPERGTQLGPRLMGHAYMGSAHFYAGKLVAACAELERSVALYDPSAPSAERQLHGYDTRAHAQSLLSLPVWLLGYPARASILAEGALAWAREINHPMSIIVALHYLSNVHAFAGDWARIEPIADELVWLAERFCRQWLLRSRLLHACCRRDLELAADVMAGFDASGRIYRRPLRHALVAETELARGMPAQAQARVDAALAQVAATGKRFYEALLHRLRGQACRMLGDEAAAEASLTRSLEVARAQTARMPELQAALALARLWAS